MISITLDKKKYDVFNHWQDITLERFVSLSRIPVPVKLKEIYSLTTETPEDKVCDMFYHLSHDELTVEFPQYYAKALKAISTIPMELINRMDYEALSTFFNGYLKHLTTSVIFDTPLIIKDNVIDKYIPPQVEFFKIAGKTYYVPKSVHVMGRKVLMADQPIIAFVEAADIDVNIKALSENSEGFGMLASIYCRRHKELYDEDLIIERERLFHSCTMDKIWMIFFCIGIPIKQFNRNLASSLSREGKRKING